MDSEYKILGRAFAIFDQNVNLESVPPVLLQEIEEFGNAMSLSAFSEVAAVSPIGRKALWSLAESTHRDSGAGQYLAAPNSVIQNSTGEKVIFSDKMLKPWDIREDIQVFYSPIVVIGNYQTVCSKMLSATSSGKQLISVDNIPVLPGTTCVYADLYNVSAFAFTMPGFNPTEAEISTYLGEYWSPSTSDYQLVMFQYTGQNVYFTYMPQFHGWMRFI